MTGRGLLVLIFLIGIAVGVVLALTGVVRLG